MNTREKIEALEAEKLAMSAAMRESDGRASKCAKLGISFEDTYPKDYNAYKVANERYNAIEAELAPLYEELEREEAEEHHPEEEAAHE